MTPGNEELNRFANIMRRREEVHKLYRLEGFAVDMSGVWRKDPHINVQFKEATVDKDFYDYE